MVRAHYALHVARIIFAGDYELVSVFDVFDVKDRRGMCHFTSLGMDSEYTVQPPKGRI